MDVCTVSTFELTKLETDSLEAYSVAEDILAAYSCQTRDAQFLYVSYSL